MRHAKDKAGVRTVFLSSTGADLREYRQAAHLAIDNLPDWKCVRMEGFGAQAADVDTFYRAKVEECDVFIGIIGNLFGSVPPGSKESYTQREYRAARIAKKPVLLFMAPDDFPVPGNLREPTTKFKAQQRFRKQLKNSGDHVVDFGFTTPAELANAIVAAMYNFVRESSGGRKRADTAAYLGLLWQDTAYIDIRGLRIANEEVHRFRIDELYTPLTTVAAPEPRKSGRPSKEEPAAGARNVPLQRALENRCVVLVGDPGRREIDVPAANRVCGV